MIYVSVQATDSAAVNSEKWLVHIEIVRIGVKDSER